jgi:hypothetical protein
VLRNPLTTNLKMGQGARTKTISFRADGFQFRERLRGWPLSRCQNGAEGFRHFSRSNDSRSQELIELGKFCNDLANPKSSEIVL